ncbi:hypothetical protein HMPREF9607_00398 [Cutibacterium modestum HL044PA1]|uniref:Uncharacterized protein n=1 Tax=Cutibacterium modestum HL044PA1 TaxID=765109 RepID=A0ABN0C7X5_9ACTN|nr:hypothetical protein HMPREF9607_00398 [Cutibacterium modestum HL044PA1]
MLSSPHLVTLMKKCAPSWTTRRGRRMEFTDIVAKYGLTPYLGDARH